MDNLTHSLFGLTLARTPLGRSGRGATAALLLASNAPDIDIVAVSGGAMKYLQWHRGPTHGPMGVIGLGLVTAAIVWFGRRAWDARGPRADGAGAGRGGDASFAMLWAVSAVGVICHVLMDLPTSYGTRPLSPFNWHWYAVDLMPIVDIYLLAILAAGLWFGSRARPGARQRNAAIVLMLMALNYGLRAASHHEALSRGAEAFGPLLPEPCASARPQGWIDSWPRPDPSHTAAAGSAANARCLLELAAVPGFISPFRWRLIAQLSNGYEMHDVDLLAQRLSPRRDRWSEPWRLSTRVPNQWTPAVVQAANTPVAQAFLGFSRFPAARSFVDPAGNAIVRWNDMRFVMSAIGDRRTASANLFGVVVRIDPGGRVVQERFGQ